MKSISKLKDDARKHEQKEEWEKAAQVYLQVLRIGDEGEGEVELPLFNRVGDLYVRLGRPTDAVTYYEQAADRYAEAGLYNNAIALCNKALRYHAENLDLLRKLGQFSASQGFLTDARRYFLEFAEKKFNRGETGEALTALEDFANVADDPEIRELLARRLQGYGRTPEAVDELRKARELYASAGNAIRADAVLEEIRTLDPGAAATIEDSRGSAGDAEDAGSDALFGGVADIAPMDGFALGHAAASPADNALLGFSDLNFDGPDAAAADAPGSLLEGLEATSAEAVEPASFGMLEGLESTSLDFAGAAAELGSVEPGMDLDRDTTSFGDLPTSDNLDDGTDEAGALPLLDGPDEDGDGAAWDDDSPVGLDLPFLDGEPEDAQQDEPAWSTDFALPEMSWGDADTSVPDLPGLPGMDDFAGEPAGDLPGLEDVPVPDDLPGLDDIPGLDEADAADLPQLDWTGPGEMGLEPVAAAGGAMTGGPVENEADGFGAADVAAEGDVAAEAVAETEAAATAGAYATPDLSAGAGTPNEGAGRSPGDSLPPVPAAVGEATRAPAVPAKADEGFIDLAALLADDEPETTRFHIQEAVPTGDEDRDFAELLSQFKAKVSEHLPPEDAAAHYDLGLAFKEMGLIDEAIGEFQVAMRAGHMRLRIYEELGDCFLQKGDYNIAEKVLLRGLEVKYDHELELIGVYYHLGRTYEGLGRREQARDAYERVLGMDIGFQDVSERLARL
jgi:tetratricopeptide (TPR) repeat protein